MLKANTDDRDGDHDVNTNTFAVAMSLPSTAKSP
jgi:hypothetical protein